MFNFSSIFFKFISLILGISDNQSFPPPLSGAEELELFLKKSDAEPPRKPLTPHHHIYKYGIFRGHTSIFRGVYLLSSF